MANKYYYNGKLVRTSEHEYTHAVFNKKGQLVGCRPSYEKAMSMITSEVSKARTEIENIESAIKAVRNGKNTYELKYNRKTINVKLEGWMTMEKLVEHLEAMRRWEAEIPQWYSIVELERR